MRFNGINHLAMATGDLDTTIRFWRDLLGMRLVAGLGEPGYRHYFFEISPTDLIAFFEWEGVKPVKPKEHGEPVKGPFVFDHVSFGMESDEDLWALKDKLDAAGFECSDMIDHGFIHSIYAFDPNGIPIEFSANVAGRDVRRQPVMGDSEPVAEARAGAEPQAGRWPAVKKPTPPSKRRIYEGAGTELFQGTK
ncbi:MAG TPA: VOC family protein [Planctomycetota bacterium]|nr:VOC family protein [Planctomycetota bacterium]HRR82246.1 VOC family protein [Planctomycetota bacterium]HRT95171.1 VOC family protein [Planctomycetota bacterium]